MLVLLSLWSLTMMLCSRDLPTPAMSGLISYSILDGPEQCLNNDSGKDLLVHLSEPYRLVDEASVGETRAIGQHGMHACTTWMLYSTRAQA